MWSDFYIAGGWGMYPTTIFGFFLLLSAALLVLRPQRRFVPLVGSLTLLTLISGLLGTSVGVINSFRYIQELPADEQFPVAVLGCAESLNNLVLACLIVAISTLLATVASVRSLRRPSTPGAAG